MLYTAYQALSDSFGPWQDAAHWGAAALRPWGRGPLAVPGLRSKIDVVTDTYAALPRLTYLSPTRVLGANIGFTAMLPLVNRQARFTASPIFEGSVFASGPAAALQSTVTSNINARVSGSQNGNESGVGDLELSPLLHWEIGDNQAVTVAPTVVLPTGKYDVRRRVNPGFGKYYTFRPSVQYSFIGDGWDVGVRGIFSFNTRNKDNGYYSGNMFNIDWQAMAFVSDDIRVGLQGYFVRQLSKDTQDLSGFSASEREVLRKEILNGNKSSVNAVGPAMGWIMNGGEMMLEGKFLQEFGARRVIDTPITEHGFTGLGVGAAFAGLKPIVEFMTFNFAMQAIDHIINSAAKTNYMSGGQMRCPIVFRGPNGAAARVGAQHSQNYGPWYASVPGLVVIAPYDSSDAKGLLKAAIRSEDPVVFLENELVYGRSFELPELDDHVLPIGKARDMREGRDVTIVSYSIGVGFALEAAEQLAAEGIEAEVLDLRTLRPLDKEAVLASLAKTNRVVVAEEGFPVCSIASEIIAICMEEGFDHLDAPVLRVCNEDVPLPYAANLERAALINAEGIVKAVKQVCYR